MSDLDFNLRVSNLILYEKCPVGGIAAVAGFNKEESIVAARGTEIHDNIEKFLLNKECDPQYSKIYLGVTNYIETVTGAKIDQLELIIEKRIHYNISHDIITEDNTNKTVNISLSGAADLRLYYKGNYYIWDWKTGVEREGNAAQILTYAMLAISELEEQGKAWPSRIYTCLYYTTLGTKKTNVYELKDVLERRKVILNNTKQLARDLIRYDSNKTLDDFSTNFGYYCLYCPFNGGCAKYQYLLEYTKQLDLGKKKQNMENILKEYHELDTLSAAITARQDFIRNSLLNLKDSGNKLAMAAITEKEGRKNTKYKVPEIREILKDFLFKQNMNEKKKDKIIENIIDFFEKYSNITPTLGRMRIHYPELEKRLEDENTIIKESGKSKIIIEKDLKNMKTNNIERA